MPCFAVTLLSSLLFASTVLAQIYITDCVQYGQPLRSHLAYYSSTSRSSQQKPDQIVQISPTSGTGQYQLTVNVPTLGDVALDVSDVAGSKGQAVINGDTYWRCQPDPGELLYTSQEHVSSLAPWGAQCLTRQSCVKAPMHGSVSILVQLAVQCDGQPTGGQSTGCGSISPVNNIFIKTYDDTSTTPLCSDVISLSADSRDYYGKSFTSSKCPVTINLGNANFLLTSWPMSGRVKAPAGNWVDIPDRNVGSSYRSPGSSSVWNFQYDFAY